MILRRIEGDRHSEVLPSWVGETVVILGGGPSLTFDQVEAVRDVHEDGLVRCIAVNDSYLWAPWADVLYAADAHWWGWHIGGIPKPLLGLTTYDVRRLMAEFCGEKCSIDNAGGNVTDENVHVLRNFHGQKHGFGLSLDAKSLVTGRNSGFQALNLAVLAGASRILLLGFDGQPSRTGTAHFFGEHPCATPDAAYGLYQHAMLVAAPDIAAAGVKVINCSPGSAIDCFQHQGLDEALHD